MSFTTDDGLFGLRGLYNFGRDFNGSYNDMLIESRRRRIARGEQVEEEEEEEEQVAMDDQDSAGSIATSGSQMTSRRVVNGREGYVDEEPAEEWLIPVERTRGYWSVGTEIYYSATEKLGGGKKTLFVAMRSEKKRVGSMN